MLLRSDRLCKTARAAGNGKCAVVIGKKSVAAERIKLIRGFTLSYDTRNLAYVIYSLCISFVKALFDERIHII